MMPEVKRYIPYSVVNIHIGEGDRRDWTYASIVNLNGKLVVSASLQYCYEWLVRAARQESAQ